MSFAAPGERDLGHSDDDERSEPAGAHSARGHDLDRIRELSVLASALRCTRISPEVEISGETRCMTWKSTRSLCRHAPQT